MVYSIAIPPLLICEFVSRPMNWGRRRPTAFLPRQHAANAGACAVQLRTQPYPPPDLHPATPELLRGVRDVGLDIRRVR